MNPIFEKVKKSYDYIRTVTDFTPEVALVLGSGLGEFAKHMEVECEIPYSSIEGFPVSTVAGHDGRFLFGLTKVLSGGTDVAVWIFFFPVGHILVSVLPVFTMSVR